MTSRSDGTGYAWAEARHRLEAAMRAADSGARPSPERQRAILDERARRAALQPDVSGRAADQAHLMTFVLSGERYGIDPRVVREVLPLADFTVVPGAPDFVVGVTNLRGEILTVIDLRRFFGLAVKGVSDLSRLIVLGRDGAEIGVLADEARELLSIDVSEIQDPPESVTRIGKQYLRGVTRDALIVLSGDVLLDDQRLLVAEAGGDGRF